MYTNPDGLIHLHLPHAAACLPARLVSLRRLGMWHGPVTGNLEMRWLQPAADPLQPNGPWRSCLLVLVQSCLVYFQSSIPVGRDDWGGGQESSSVCFGVRELHERVYQTFQDASARESHYPCTKLSVFSCSSAGTSYLPLLLPREM